MIALPVQSNSVDSEVAPLFGKAEWFAFIDDDRKVVFWKNALKSGREVVEHFKTLGVQDVIFQNMDTDQFNLLEQAGITCHHTGRGQVLCAEAIVFFRYQKLVKVTTNNVYRYVEQSHEHCNGSHLHVA